MLTSANVIIYLRKSRSDDPSMSVDEVLAKHESILQEYAINNYGSPIPEEQIYREVCSGETIADRPVMLQVMRLIEARIYGGVLVVEPQRLSRGDLEDCGKIINAFRYTETLVVTPPKTYDLLDDYDRKFFEMELMRGNDYLEYTKKILFRGRMASSKQGNFIGSIAPYGYRKVVVGSGKDAYHTLEIEPTESEAVKIMYHLYLDESYGFKKIANRLDELGFKPRKVDHWSAATIQNILENPVYCGKIQFNRRSTKKKFVDGELVKTRPLVTDPEKVVYVDGKHPALIDEARFRETMERRGKNPCVRKSKELTNPFAGLLYCGTCGHAMSHKKFYQHYKKSVCENMLCNDQARCHTKSVSYDAFVNRVTTSLEETIANFEMKLKNGTPSDAMMHQNQIRNLENELQHLKQRDMRQKDAYEDGIYTKEEYAQRNAKLQEQIASTTASLKAAKESSGNIIDYQEKLCRFRDALNALNDPDLPASKKNTLLKACIIKIVYYNDMPSLPGIGRYVENVFKLDIFYKL